MSNFGYHNGLLKAKGVELTQKKLKTDIVPYFRSSALGLKTAFAATGSAAILVATALDCPRAVKFVNAMGGTAERKVKIFVEGYDAQGNEAGELFTLTTGQSGATRGNIPFSYITKFTPLGATKGYGTYGTVGLLPTDKVGLTEYCEDQADILNVRCWGATAGNQYSATAYPINSTTFSVTYQTLDFGGMVVAPAGSTLAITYRSKFQRRA